MGGSCHFIEVVFAEPCLTGLLAGLPARALAYLHGLWALHLRGHLTALASRTGIPLVVLVALLLLVTFKVAQKTLRFTLQFTLALGLALGLAYVGVLR
jgi:hypothetical protein